MNIKYYKHKILNEFDKHFLYKSESDNPILFTTEFYILCKLANIIDNNDVKRFDEAIYHLWRRENGKIIYGLLNRRPNDDKRKDQHDNYTACAASLYFSYLGKLYAKYIYTYGKYNFWSFDNRKPFKFSFECFHQPHQVFFYKLIADKWFLPHEYLWFILSNLFIQNKYDTSSKFLQWMRYLCIKDKWYIKPIYKLWSYRMNKMYPNGLIEIFKIYHGESSDLYKLCEFVNCKF